jgi:hypothetical protein
LPIAERKAVLDYYTEFLKVLAFHEKEADRYNEEGMRFQNGQQGIGDIEVLMKAAQRLTVASEESLRRLEALPQVPEPASKHFASWQGVLDWTVKWSSANHEALRLMSLGQDRSAANAQSYHAVLMDLQAAAERKSSDLLSHLELTQSDASRLLAQAALSLGDWSPG